MFNALERNPILQWLYFRKSDTEKIGMLCIGFSMALLASRVLYTGQMMFLFLGWNLFLAWLPYVVSAFLIRRPDYIERERTFIPLFILWLIFLPNSFYILTDLFHLRIAEAMPLWFDLALLLSFAWNGLLLGVLSIRQMEKIVAAAFTVKTEAYFIYPVMLLNAFGIYIGRYLRYNSWDIVTNPFPLFQDVVYLLAHPIRHRFDWSMILCFSVLMMLLYLSMKRISKSIG